MKAGEASYSENFLRRVFAAADRDALPETPPSYPPIGAWAPVTRGAGIFSVWKKSIELHGDIKPVVYVHVPFCETLCRFCGFYRITARSKNAVPAYLAALKKEISLYSGLFRKTELRFLCVGGGTPSIMSARELEEFFGMLHGGFRLTADAKTAFEASPATLTLEKLRVIKSAGVDWLAIGAQSLDGHLLKNLNRNQTRADVLRSVALARKAGINNVELDLMVGSPGQSAESFLADAKAAAELDLERVHIFDYQPKALTCVSGEVKKGSLEGAPLEQARALRRKALDLLLAKGYSMQGGHMVYKRRGDAWPYSYDRGEEGAYSILGLGPSAISYALDGARCRNVCDEKAYEAALAKGLAPVDTGFLMEEKDEMINFVLLEAMNRGQIDSAAFRERFGKSLKNSFPAELGRLTARGVLVESGKLFAVMDRARAVFELRKEFYRPGVIKSLADNLGLKDDLPSGPGAAAAGEVPLNVSRADVYECRLAGPAGLEFYGGAKPGRPKPPEEIMRELLLAAAAGSTEALLCTGQEPDARALRGAVRAAVKLGFKTISVLCPAGATRALPWGLLAKLGAGRLSLVGGADEEEALVAAAGGAGRTGLEVTVVIKLDKKNLARTGRLIGTLESPGVKKFILFFPRYSAAGGQAHKTSGLEIEYKDIRILVLEAGKYVAGGGRDVRFHNVPLCVLAANWRLAGDLLSADSGAGDARESDRGAGTLKIKACLGCRFLLKCAGPFSDYVRKFGHAEIRAVK